MPAVAMAQVWLAPAPNSVNVPSGAVTWPSLSSPQQVAVPAVVPESRPQPQAAPARSGGRRELELLVGPLETPDAADNLIELFSEIVDLGSIEPLDGGQSADGMRRFKIVTTSSDADLLDLFTFHVSREHVKLLPLGPGYGFHAGAPGAPVEHASDAGFGFFDNAPGSPAAAGQAAFEYSTR